MSKLESIAAICFWCSLTGVLYAYAGYPILSFLLSKVFGRRPVPPVVPDADLPTLSLLIVAYNEEAVIADRLANALALDYPSDRLEIVIASDGSDDRTVEICTRWMQAVERVTRVGGGRKPRIRTLAFPARRGKAATLSAAMERIDSAVVVFSDANTTMQPDALRRLARWFFHPSIGAVCGRLVLTDPQTGRNADSLYWRFETFLKDCENRLGGPLGANGGIYALRRALFEPLPQGTVVDDFVIPLAAQLRSGCRIVFDHEAVAHEETAPDLGAEFNRRARIGVGGFQALGLLWPLLSPSHGWTALALWSHKVFRWVCPFFLIGAFLGAVALVGHPVYRISLIAQLALYTLTLIAALVPSKPRALNVLPMFLSMNLALLVGFSRWLSSRPTGIWKRTARPPNDSRLLARSQVGPSLVAAPPRSSHRTAA